MESGETPLLRALSVCWRLFPSQAPAKLKCAPNNLSPLFQETMNRLLSLLLLLAAGQAAVFSADAKPLNIVVLYADDWRYDTLGCAGNPVVKTPNLDRLAQEGFRFTHACVTTSICGVSRASLLTGQWMSRHGNPAFAMFKTPWAETYPGPAASQRLLGRPRRQVAQRQVPRGAVRLRPRLLRHALDQAARRHARSTSRRRTRTTRSSSCARGQQDKPFCLTLAFFATHAEDGNPKQYLPQPESMALYQDVTIPVPKTATEESFRKLPPFIANEKNEGRSPLALAVRHAGEVPGR